MKSRCRQVSILLSCVTAIGLIFLGRHLSDLANQYSAGSYLIDSLDLNTNGTIPPPAAAVGDKVIVMARLEEENTGWVEEHLPDWQRAIYIVNPSEASLRDPDVLTTPVNKGHESMAYLTYIIDHYTTLPSSVAFLHPHRAGFLQAWHVDAPLHDNVLALQALQLNFVQSNGYVNLRCNRNPGCLGKKLHRRYLTAEVWNNIFYNSSTSTGIQSGSESISESAQPLAKNGIDKGSLPAPPGRVGVACCAQFAVSRNQVLQRPLSDYVKFRQWVIDTPETDAVSGRVMEYLWHVIFGKDPIYCPEEDKCYCEVYGRCK